MDCLGCNVFHGRILNSPVFETKNYAKRWVKEQMKSEKLSDGMLLSNHHVGADYCLKCDDRESEIVHIGSRGRIS